MANRTSETAPPRTSGIRLSLAVRLALGTQP